jgi:ABC-type glycerol-3-phosphate transport system permease component
MVPFVIYVIPLFVLFSQLGLTDNLVILGIAIAAVNVPFGIFLAVAYLRSGLPRDVVEAARVDGATTWQEFSAIVLPLMRPALGTLAALGFIWAWGDLLMSVIFIQSADNYTMTVATSTISRNSPQHGASAVQVLAAAGLIAIVPLALVFLLFQRAISRGLVAGVGR